MSPDSSPPEDGPAATSTPAGDLNATAVEAFDRHAAVYAEKYFHLGIYAPYLERFAAGIPAGGRVLDVACGPGSVSAFLARARPDLSLVGVDLAPRMIAEARARVPAGEFLVRDCRALGDLGAPFDAAAFAFGMSYLTDADVDALFGSLARVSGASARLYLSTITGARAESGFESSSKGDRVYVEYRSVDEVLARVERAGYRITLAERIPSPAEATKATEDLVVLARRRSPDPPGGRSR